MPRHIVLQQHLPPDELYRRYKNTRNAVARRKLHALYLIATGYSGADVARKLGMSRSWVSKIVLDYNALGADHFKAKNKGRAGRKIEMTEAELEMIIRVFGEYDIRSNRVYRIHKVDTKALRADIEEALGIRRSESTIRRYLQLIGTLTGYEAFVPGGKQDFRPSPKQVEEISLLIAALTEKSSNGSN